MRLRRYWTAIFSALLVCGISTALCQASNQPPYIDVDDAADEARLNRELWETMKGVPFSAVAEHLAGRVGKQPAADVTVSLPNGWRIAPAGTQVEVGRLPYAAVKFAGQIVVLNGGYYSGKTKPEISVVDPVSGSVRATVHLDSLFPSAQVSGDSLFISGGNGQCVYRLNSRFELAQTLPVAGYVGALAMTDSGHLAVSCLVSSDSPQDFSSGRYHQGKLYLLDAATGAIAQETSLGYFPYALCHSHGKLYAALLGENRVQVLDDRLQHLKVIDVGASPQQIVDDGPNLYVVNANSDSVTVIDSSRDEVRTTISVRGDRTAFGSAPTSIAVGTDRLYISLANVNAVAVFDKGSLKRLGSIPTGWYPTFVLADDERLITLCAKGIHARRPNPHGPQPVAGPRNGPDYVLTLLRGSVGLVLKSAIAPNLKEWTRAVDEGSPLLAVRADRDSVAAHVPLPHRAPRPDHAKRADSATHPDSAPRPPSLGDKDPTPARLGEEASRPDRAAGAVREIEPVGMRERGFELPIRHIFYIVRENRTYDQVMGDLPRANGDPFLTLFGREVTPNGHRLAETFVTLDNYYADGEVSVLGHSFTTSGYASPFLEWLGNAKYSDRYQGYPFGTVPAATSPAYLWDALDAKRVDYRIYGENYYLYTRAYQILREELGVDSEPAKKFYARMMGLAAVTDRGNLFYKFAQPFYGRGQTVREAEDLLKDPAFTRGFSEFLVGDGSLATELAARPRLAHRFAEYLFRYPFNYRSWDLTFSDLDRAAAWRQDFEDQVRRGKVASLHYIWLPNDHTAGGGRIPLPPDQFVAQNDAALGKIVEIISHSPVWKQSLILVTEDDAQNGPDHVDATRTVALAIGPYVRRGAVVSDRYDQLSLLRTIEVLLGLAPMNRTDALAVPMFGIFADQPDFTPFERPELSSHLSEEDRKRAQRL